jgi:hypothetical protein
MASRSSNQVIDERRRGHNVIWGKNSDWHDLLSFGNYYVCGHSHQRIEVARGHCVGQIADMISAARIDQGKLGAQGPLEQKNPSIDFQCALALLDQRADPRGC